MIIVVPDEVLFRISFPALWNKSTKRFLIEHAVVIISPSWTLYARAIRRDRQLATDGAKGHPLVFADPIFDQDGFRNLPRLPRAAQEANGIRQLFPDSEIIAGASATPEIFASRAPQARLLHFAGHAISSPDRPLESYLVLTPSEPLCTHSPRRSVRVQHHGCATARLAGRLELNSSILDRRGPSCRGEPLGSR
jgi:CHAT domain-containing protein